MKQTDKGDEMREIKFRAWDVKAQKMYYSHGDCDECGRVQLFHGDWEIDTIFPSGDDAGTIPCDGKKAILMEYTGLKDRNGVEIYEGDILETYFSGSHTGGVMEYEVTHTGAGWTKFLPLDRYEVIGNIHENPELIPK